MDVYKQIPERIISGFFHLTWIVLLVFVILGAKPMEVADYIKNISSGAAALIASTMLGAAFFLGNLLDRVIGEAVRIYLKLRKISPKPILTLKTNQIKYSADQILELENNYKDKAFFRSISIAGLAINALLLCWNVEYIFSRVGLSILIVGFTLELMTLRISFVLRKKYSDLYDKLKTKQ